MHFAVFNGDNQTLACLLGAGADVNQLDAVRRTPHTLTVQPEDHGAAVSGFRECSTPSVCS